MSSIEMNAAFNEVGVDGVLVAHERLTAASASIRKAPSESVDVSMVTNEEIEPTSAASDATIDRKDTAAIAQGSRRNRLLRNRPSS